MAAPDTSWPPLLVFPEGTTTNNRFMMPFRTGALLTPSRHQLVYIRYCNPAFSPTWEAVPFWVSLLGIMTQWRTPVEVCPRAMPLDPCVASVNHLSSVIVPEYSVIF